VQEFSFKHQNENNDGRKHLLDFFPMVPLARYVFSPYFRAKWRPLFIYFSLLTGPSRIIVTCTGQINLASTFAHIGDEVTVVSTETEKCCQPL